MAWNGGGWKQGGAAAGSWGGAARPPAAAQKPAAAAAASKDAPTLTVSTQSKKDEIGIQTLVGDYVTKGQNHGRTFYQKVQKIQGHEDIKVFLYYWDTRDGPDFSGWWFGDQVGGSQVWARVNSHGQTPPRVGWKIPWDAAKAEPGILLVDPYKAPAPGAAAAQKPYGVPAAAGGPRAVGPAAAGGASGGVSGAAAAALVKKATEQVTSLEKTANEALKSAKEKLAGGDVPEATLQELLQSLQAQQQAILEAQKTLTQDINEARKGGVQGTSSVTELSRLSPKVRQLQALVTGELGKVKAKVQNIAANAKNKEKVAADAAKQKIQEEKDSKALEEELPAALELVSTAEDGVESVSIMATPLINEPPEDSSDVLAKAMDEIETASADAQNKITEARKQINTKLQGARQFAPETRKKALTEFSTLQTKLTEAQKKLNPYKNFRKEFKARVEAKKALVEITDKLSASELEVEKASMMSSAAEQGQMSEDEVTTAEKAITPAQQGIAAAMRIIESKLRGADGPMKDELNACKDRVGQTKKKLDGIVTVLRRQREGLSTQQMLQTVGEKIDKAEQALVKCQEAEMPFLKGIEVLPQDESNKAISESEAASSQGDAAISQALQFIKTKTVEAKRYTADLQKSVTDELNTLKTRAEGVKKKIDEFKKETLDRKMSALLAEVVEGVNKAEEKVKLLTEAAAVFAGESLEKVSVEELKEAGTKTSAVEKEASAACLEARKVLGTKTKEATSPDAKAALNKLQARMNASQQELAKCRKAAMNGDKLVKGKEILTEEEKKVTEAEGEVEKAEVAIKPAEGEKMTDEAVKEVGEKIAAAQKTLKASSKVLELQLSTAVPAMKSDFQKLVDRCKKALEKLTAVLAATKDQRERVMSDAYVQDGLKKVAEVESAMEKVNDAELPFLKGLEVLPLQETNDTIKESEAAAATVQAAISAARTFIASKNIEVRQFAEGVAKPTAEEFTKLTERINAAAAKLGQFRKDTDIRKKTALMQEAGEKMTTAEEAVKKMSEAIKPFMKKEPAKKEEKKEEEKKEGEVKEGEEKKEEPAAEPEEPVKEMTEEESVAACEQLVAVSKETSAALEAVRAAIGERQKDAKAPEGQKEALQKLQERYKAAQMEFAKAKKVATDHEQKFVAKKLLAEAGEQIAGMEEDLKTTADFCAPLTEQGGEEYLVIASITRLATILREHMKTEDLSIESLYAKVSAGGSLSQEAFTEYLEKLPEAISRDEVTFTEARRKAIAKVVDADKDGSINMADFKTMFVRRYICVKSISITDVFEISKSKTTGKLEEKDVVEALDNPKTDESNGMTRIECKVIGKEEQGFVTLAGNQGTAYLEDHSLFTNFCAEMDKTTEESQKKISKVSTWLNSKMNELKSSGSSGPLAETRAELVKLRSKVTNSNTGLDALKKKIAIGKRDFAKKEVAEKNAHIEAREKKQADEVIGSVAIKMEAVEAAGKKLEETATPLTSLKGAEITAFDTPATVFEECEKLVATLTETVKEAKALIKEEVAKVMKVIKGPLLDCKKELLKMQAKADASGKTGVTRLTSVKQACATIVEANMAKVSAALRTQVQTRGITLDAFFEELCKGGEKISEDAFCSHVSSLEGASYKAQQLLLLCRHIEAGGIGRRRFFSFLQKYFVVVKGIAITSEFDIAKAKTMRKAELDEVIEVLEGPTADEKVGLQRIRGRSLSDGAEGWISVKGNQGTAFLKEVEKPFYSCTKEIAFEKAFKTDEEPIRMLKADEVLELIEGPRKETFEPALRVRGKATSDAAQGWFTVRDKKGTIFATSETKHYTCTTSVAMTDELDIKNCKVIRKLAVGEVFTVLEGPIEDKDAGITRMKGKTLKDDKDGWITTKGNAGTVYAEASSKHFTIVQDTPLQKKMQMTGTVEEVRMLSKGEVLQSLEGPKEQAFPPEVRMKGKALSDGASGWITVEGNNVKSWSPIYKCLIKGTPLQDTKVSEGATVVRELEKGESLEIIEGPETLETKELRMKAKAEKDGAIGWVTIKDKEGKKLLD